MLTKMFSTILRKVWQIQVKRGEILIVLKQLKEFFEKCFKKSQIIMITVHSTNFELCKITEILNKLYGNSE